MALTRHVCATRAAALAAAALLIAVPHDGPAAQSPEPRVIEVLARRFAFEPSTIEVKVGERIRLVMVSADGVHGVEIKKFKVKKEIPRGKTPVTVDFTADTPGEFPILCSEYCGEGHEAMTGTLVVRAEGPPTGDVQKRHETGR